MTYWIVVGLPENFQIASKRGFDMFGFKSTRRSETSTMRPGDKLVFYLTGVKKFAGIATVTSESFEEHTRIFKSEKKPNEDFPFRVQTKAEIALPEEKWLNVPDFAPLLEMTRKGAMKSWGMAFQGNLHRISDADYRIIEDAMRAAAKGKASAKASRDGKTRPDGRPSGRAAAKSSRATPKRRQPARGAAKRRAKPRGRQRTRRG